MAIPERDCLACIEEENTLALVYFIGKELHKGYEIGLEELIKIFHFIIFHLTFCPQRKFVSVECHAHSNAHKPPKTVAPTVLMLK